MSTFWKRYKECKGKPATLYMYSVLSKLLINRFLIVYIQYKIF